MFKKVTINPAGGLPEILIHVGGIVEGNVRFDLREKYPPSPIIDTESYAISVNPDSIYTLKGSTSDNIRRTVDVYITLKGLNLDVKPDFSISMQVKQDGNLLESDDQDGALTGSYQTISYTIYFQ